MQAPLSVQTHKRTRSLSAGDPGTSSEASTSQVLPQVTASSSSDGTSTLVASKSTTSVPVPTPKTSDGPPHAADDSVIDTRSPHHLRGVLGKSNMRATLSGRISGLSYEKIPSLPGSSSSTTNKPSKSPLGASHSNPAEQAQDGADDEDDDEDEDGEDGDDDDEDPEDEEAQDEENPLLSSASLPPSGEGKCKHGPSISESKMDKPSFEITPVSYTHLTLPTN